MSSAALWSEHLELLTRQVALIGDPGQIMPWLPDTVFCPADSPLEPLPEHLLRVRPRTTVEFSIAVTRRNPRTTTDGTGLLPAYAASPTVPMSDDTTAEVT